MHAPAPCIAIYAILIQCEHNKCKLLRDRTHSPKRSLSPLSPAMQVSSHRTRPLLSASSATLILFSVIVLLKFGLAVWLNYVIKGQEKQHTYIGDDYPETWPVERATVIMASDSTKRYHINTTDGIAQWKSLLPGGNGLVYLGPERRPFTISMMHSLRCLDIVREEMVRDRSTNPGPGENTELARHCLNYLKQMVLCRGDSQIEPFWYNTHTGPLDLWGMYECKDWGAVWNAVKENQAEYERWSIEKSS
ncbi:hypothetical protein K474DRAFT_1660155, partial [Panus rudis PR-1116 ss-1]